LFIRLLALFILVPIVELVLLLQLAKYTSVMATLALVVVTGLVGTALARSQGARTFRQIALELQQGRLPTDAVLDAAAIFVAGALLLTPGLLTDLAGIVLLIPFMRRRILVAVGRWLRSRFQLAKWTAEPTTAGRSTIVDSYVIDAPSRQPPDQPGG
jgi:UPF0716 protein FxsA